MKKRNILTIGLLILMILLLCFPNLCLHAAQNGLLLWFNKVLPSMLPFMIFINILVPLNGLQGFISHCTPLAQRLWHLPGESFFAFLMGVLAGYPMGAKVVKNLYCEHKLSLNEAERTLCFCNNCGPLFIIGTVGTAMLSKTSLGYFLLLIHLLSAFIMSLLLTHNLPISTSTRVSDSTLAPPVSFFRLLNLSVINAMDTIVCVGGYIILFSVLLALMTQTPFAQFLLGHLTSTSEGYLMATGVLSSVLELSNGAHALSKLSLSTYSLACLSAAIGFGGICVYFQSLFVLEDTPFNTKPFFIAKCIQGVLSFALTLLLHPLYLIFTSTKGILYTLNTYNHYFSFNCPCFILLFLLCFWATYQFFPSNQLRQSFYKYKKKPN